MHDWRLASSNENRGRGWAEPEVEPAERPLSGWGGEKGEERGEREERERGKRERVSVSLGHALEAVRITLLGYFFPASFDQTF